MAAVAGAGRRIRPIRSRPTTTGPAEAVDRFVTGHTVLRERQLGPTKSTMVYGGLDERDRRQARDAGLDLGPVALQDLFVHLTQPSAGPR